MTILYHEIVVQAAADRVWSLLTTRSGLAQWWPGEISTQGGDSWLLHISAVDSLVFRVVEEEPESVLEWLCTQGDSPWHNTLVHWRIEGADHDWRIIMEHRDLRESHADLAALNTHWGLLLNAIAEQLVDERHKA